MLLDTHKIITQVFHSGKLRAAQTAEIFTDTLNLPSASTIAGLLPNDNIALLTHNLNVNHALYIGHLPHLEKLTASLLANDENQRIIKFLNSGVACLEKNDNSHLLHWYFTPATFKDPFKQP